MKLEWLRIDRFRWVQPGTVLHFRPGMNAIIGMNGSGKTTLLNLLAAVWGSDFSPYKDEEVEVSYQFRADSGTNLVRLQSSKIDVGGADGSVQEVQPRFRRFLRIDSMSGGTGAGIFVELTVRPENIALEAGIIGAGGAHAGKPETGPESVPSSDMVGDVIRLLGTRLDPFGQASVWANLHVLAWAHFFGERKVMPSGVTALLGGKSTPMSLPSSRFKALPLRYWEGSDWAEAALRGVSAWGHWRGDGKGLTNQSYGNVPSELAPELLAGLSEESELPYVLQVSGPDSPMGSLDASEVSGRAGAGKHRPDEPARASWLQALAATLGMRQITLDFRLSAGPIQGNAQPFTYTLSGLFIKKHDGTVLNSFNQLSHGQKRLFGLLWYLGCSPDVLIADELSNGMHWQMVDRVIDAIGERQCFLAMQDPALLDHMEFESAEDVARAFVSCATAMVDGREQWTWRSFTAEEAEDFYASYKKGWRQVNEILRARGLW